LLTRLYSLADNSRRRSPVGSGAKSAFESACCFWSNGSVAAFGAEDPDLRLLPYENENRPNLSSLHSKRGEFERDERKINAALALICCLSLSLHGAGKGDKDRQNRGE